MFQMAKNRSLHQIVIFDIVSCSNEPFFYFYEIG